MSTFGFNTTVSSQEAEALKEMIFKRARERAQALNQEVQSDYTTAIQNDIMDLARDSFVATKNPFSCQEENEKHETNNNEDKAREIGFAKREVHEIKKQIEIKNKNSNTDFVQNEIESTMSAASENYSKKTSFIGALEFLNSQASIALIKNKGQYFEALA